MMNQKPLFVSSLIFFTLFLFFLKNEEHNSCKQKQNKNKKTIRKDNDCLIIHINKYIDIYIFVVVKQKHL